MTTGRRRAASSREDELLSGLYQQVTEQQAVRFAAGYDMAAGLDRYQAWLDERTAEEQARPQAIRVAVPTPMRTALADSGVAITAAAIGGPVILDQVTPGSTGSGMPADWDADRAVTALYHAHYGSLVHLAALLVYDVATAEEIVQDSFVAMHAAWRRLGDNDKALSYLRQSVVNRSRSAIQPPVVADRDAPEPAPDLPSAGLDALTLLERSAVVTALRALPRRQREVLVLRFYAELSEAQIASTMGISPGAVKSHMARATASLRAVLETER
jgi:RNA polymerase sigma-70 factor (sigma-E family)